jgi:uncharacterized protein (UPF0332 family)
MQLHIDKARNNEKFLAFIESNITDDFIDWKITVTFYAALHYIKALLKAKHVADTHSHTKIDLAINPGNKNRKFAMPGDYYQCYRELYEASRNARYTVVYSNQFQILLQKMQCEQSKQNLSKLKEYVKNEGVKI